MAPSVVCFFMQENHNILLDSLLCTGIDAASGNCSHQTIARRAKVGSASIMRFVFQSAGLSETATDFVKMLISTLKQGKYTRAMAYIYGAYDMTGRFPPYGILQHAVREDLLQEYCLSLKEELTLTLNTCLPLKGGET